MSLLFRLERLRSRLHAIRVTLTTDDPILEPLSVAIDDLDDLMVEEVRKNRVVADGAKATAFLDSLPPLKPLDTMLWDIATTANPFTTLAEELS